MGDHYEPLRLNSFAVNNVRGLRDLCDRLATCLAPGTDAPDAVRSMQ